MSVEPLRAFVKSVAFVKLTDTLIKRQFNYMLGSVKFFLDSCKAILTSFQHGLQLVH
jgi:hypothetical protein